MISAIKEREWLVQGSQGALRLLGSPRVVSDGSDVTGLPAKFYALAALLALAYDGSASRSILASRLWEDRPSRRANASIRMLLLAVRQAERRHRIWLVNADHARVWRDSFSTPSDLDALLAVGGVEARGDLSHLNALYGGDLLAGLDFPDEPELDQWIRIQRTRLRDRFVAIAVPAAQRIGGPEAGEILRRLSDDLPYDDTVERALLFHLAHETSGAAARAEYQRFRHRLKTDLDEKPELETTALVAQLAPVRRAATTRSASGDASSPIDAATLLAAGSPVQSEPKGVPRILILPPPSSGYRVSRQQALLAASLIDDVTFALCRFRSFMVFAPHTARQLVRGNPFLDFSQYGTDYVLSTRLLPGRAAGELRFGLSLTRISTHEVLLGDDFQFTPDQLFSRQADLAGVIATRVASKIEREELATFRQTGSASAYVQFLLGQEHMRIVELKDLRKARRAFHRAVQLKPDFAPALSMTARTLTLEWLLLGREERDLLDEARKLAGRAVELDPFDASGHRELGHVAMYMHELDESLHHLSHAHARSPHHADILINEADALIHNSQSAAAVPLVKTAMELNPLPPDPYHWIGATVAFFQGDYPAALDGIRRMKNPDPAMRFASACAAMVGDLALAADYRDRIMARQPDFRLVNWKKLMPLKSEVDKERYLEALRRAGFPE